MDFSTLKERRVCVIPAKAVFTESYDVVVVGLGTVGAQTAILCGRENLRTLGIERTAAMGGISVHGGISGEGWYGSPGGAREDLLRCADEMNCDGLYARVPPYTGPAMSLFYEKEAQKHGVKVEYETVITGVYIEQGKVTGLRVCSAGKSRDIGSGVVIDSTTDCIVCRMAGCQIVYGRALDQGKMALSKVNVVRKANGEIQPISPQVESISNPTAEEDAFQILRLSQISPVINTAGSTGIRVLSSAPVLGQREEGHVVTEQTVTLRDCMNGILPEKPLYSVIAPADLVRMDHCYAFEDDAFQDYRVLCGMSHYGYSAVIPYGSLIPRGVEGLLVASKCFGVDHSAAGGLRMIGMLQKAGEAAAYAAALSIREGVSLRDVPYDKLSAMLLKTGCSALDRNLHIVDLSMPLGKDGVYETVRLPDIQESISLLSQDVMDNPDVIFSINAHMKMIDRVPAAFFAALQSRTSILPEGKMSEFADALAKEADKGGRYAGNFAVALALCGDRRALPVLRSIVSFPGERNPYKADPVIEDTYPNRIKALCLLGRFREREDFERIFQVIADDGMAFTQDLKPCGYFSTQARYAYEAVCYAVAALLQIIAESPDEDLKFQLRQWSCGQHSILKGYWNMDALPGIRHCIELNL